MKNLIYTIHDKKADAFLRPFYSLKEELAIRDIQSLLLDPTHAFAQFPEDYSLYYLGEYDDSTGIITTPDLPKPISNLAHFPKQPTGDNP